MFPVRNGLATGFTGLLALLAALEASSGLGMWAWGLGLLCGLAMCAAVARGQARAGSTSLSIADAVTLSRTVLGCGVAAVVAESLTRGETLWVVVPLAVVALGLDAVDGHVARRTGSASLFGARFDGEADAFLILVLSVLASTSAGGWVLAIGAARYAFALAGFVLPWMRRRLPPRYWRKVVTAVQGVVLTVAVAGVVPRAWTQLALVLALVLLTESFGRDVLWLWRRRDDRDDAGLGAPARPHRTRQRVT